MTQKQALRIVRRIHLYSGLLFFPWVFLFGISGLLFNHPNVGEKVEGARLAGADLSRITGLSAWNPQALAARLTGELNTQQPGAGYALDSSFASEFSGVNVFAAQAPEGRHLVLLDMQQGAGIVATRKARPQAEPAPFSDVRVPLPEFSSEFLQDQLSPLLAARGLTATGPLRAHPKIRQHLRFRLVDKEGVRWNATYDLRDGKLAGRQTDQWPNIGITQWVGKLHKTHHFPARPGVRTLWALLEDLLGLTLTFWAGSGLIMWWQLKATRRAGMFCIAGALSVATFAIWSLSEDLLFGPVGQAMGPGE